MSNNEKKYNENFYFIFSFQNIVLNNKLYKKLFCLVRKFSIQLKKLNFTYEMKQSKIK